LFRLPCGASDERSRVKAQEKKLLELFRDLSEDARRTLLEFAAFLASRNASAPPELPEPLRIARPEEESVVKAIKRLMASYHMLDRDKLLHETAHLMSQHTIHGRPAAEVIEDLERMFERHYEALKQKHGHSG
jgi:hypothetical protein